MQFCDECGSMMLVEDAVWRCQSCESGRPRDPEADPKMTLRDRQQGDDPTPVVEEDDDSDKTVEEDCPAAGCDSERARYEMMPEPRGSYEVRLFTCVECGRKWRG
ncbi:DNA-directed RNA polymerase subunit M [Halobacteriales archaeon QH_7_66_36]|nr:MAG: DNA-directed RNA polymerase subunit M [Halobacteriales archaeon QH_7_66_36]